MINERPHQSFADAMDETQAQPEYDATAVDWLSLAKDSHKNSTDYLNSNIRKQWEKSQSHQNNEHASGSKYLTPAYKGRSRTFRPKTRTNNISAEATLAAALFSTSDLVSITPVDDSDESQVISAEINQQLLQHRLTKSIKWFLTSMGAYQNTRVEGVCFSHQYWSYEEISDSYEIEGELNEEGMPVTEQETRIVKDKPCIDLLPPENIRIDPNADWRDPINDSPYVVRLVPMHAIEAIEMMKKQSIYPWVEDITLNDLISAGSESEEDTTRKQRQGSGRTDPTDASSSKELDMIWLHQNFVRRGGEDVVYWTAGTHKLLSDPIPTSEAYPHLDEGERPIVMGIGLIEAHKNYPSSPTRLIESLQIDANDIANQRFDNVKLVLNKRYFIRRGQTGIDTSALMRNTPGSAVVMSDPDRDVKVVDTNDVTGSSYQEQDRLDLAMDEITGTFSQQSVQNNRNLNETVGGMEMMNAGSNNVSEYSIRIFIETWVEPVIRQLVKLEQYYENDQKILAVAAGKSDAYQQHGVDQVTDELLRQELTINVNVGFGATNPQQKMDRIGRAMNAVSFLPSFGARVDEDEVIREVFGASGYRDGQRFFKPMDEVEPQEPPVDQAKMKELELKGQQMAMDKDNFVQELQLRREIEMMKLSLQQNIKMSELQTRLGIAQTSEKNKRDIAAGKQTLEASQQVLQNKNLEQGYDTY